MVTTNNQPEKSKSKQGQIAKNIIGRISIVILYTLCFTPFLYLLLFFENVTFLPITLKLTLLISISFISGILSRYLLSSYEFWIQYTVSILSYLINLWVLYLISGGYIGINISERITYTSILDEMGQVILGAFVSWKTLTSWNPKIQSSASKVGSEEKPAKKKIKVKKPTSNIDIKNEKTINTKLTNKKQKNKKVFFRGRFLKKTSKIVQLSENIEHNCPYCLETVLTNDIRGIKKCKVCKTLHHADCWEVTGLCQVPHQ